MSPTHTDSSSTGTTRGAIAGVSRLTGKDSYPSWSLSLQLYLKREKQWKVVSGSVLKPPASTDVAAAEDSDDEDETSPLDKWLEVDDSAKYNIISTVNEEQRQKLFRLGDEATSKEYWDLLKKENRPTGDVGLQSLLSQFHLQQYKDGDDMDAFLAKMRSLSLQLANLGEPVSDVQFIVVTKRALPSSWDTIKFLLDGSTKMDKEEFILRISQEADRRSLESTTSPSSNRRQNAGALSAQQHHPSNNRRQGGRSNNSSPRKSTARKTDECYNCHRLGHHAHECRSPKKDDNSNSHARPARSTEKFALAVTISTPSSLFARSARLEEENWIVDSGAGAHFTGHRDAISNWVDFNTTVEIANGSRIVSPGFGSVSLRTGRGSEVTLAKVLYLPGATTGLLSVTSLADSGADVTFKSASKTAIISQGDKMIASTLEDTPYILDAHSINPKVAIVEKVIRSDLIRVLSSRETVTARLMEVHRRYGHIAPSTILKIVDQGLVNGIKLSDRTITDCEACLISKSRRSPFTAETTPAPHSLYRVFMDLGFVDVKDHNGADIYLAIVDQFSTAKWTFPLTSKRAEGIVGLFTDWRRSVELLTGHRIRRVRTDNGSEFINSKFKAELARLGIIHETTAPYTPEQNSQVERLNGSTMSLVKTMLVDSKLDKAFWSYALAFATFVGNRTVHARLGNKTAFEAFTGKKPYVGHLRPFGAKCFVHIDKSLRYKLDDSAVEGILLGCDGEHNYVVWLVNKQRTVVTRHITMGRQEAAELDTVELPISEGPQQHFPSSDSSLDSQRQDPTPASTQVVAADKPDDGYEYIETRVGKNPGQFEEIDSSNIISSRLRSRLAVLNSEKDDSIMYLRLALVQDQEEPSDSKWEEISVLVGIAMPGDDVPRSFQDAISPKFRPLWQPAIDAEYQAFEDHNVFRLCSLPSGARALGADFVFTMKKSGPKARLVAKGYAQRIGIDVKETFAPVARANSIRMFVARAASLNLVVHQFDFDTAFLNGKMEEDVYIKIPPGYPGKSSPGDVLKLVGSMYGTRQAPREWGRALDRLMARQDWTRSISDPCVYTKTKDGFVISVAFYVDDGLIAAPKEGIINAELDFLHLVFKLKKLGLVDTFLSLEFVHSPIGILLHQTSYVTGMCKEFGFDSPSTRASASTPMDDRPSSVVDSAPYLDIPLFQSAVGALLYASMNTRPDISVAVRAVSQRVVAPTQADWIAVKRIFLYLSSHLDFGIVYLRNGSLVMESYSDASWADDPESRRSVGGYCIKLAGGVIAWRSKQQSLVATSTTESEIIAASDTTKEVLALRKLATDLDMEQPSPSIIFEDNSACITIAKNPGSRAGSKHFDTTHMFVADRVARGEVDLVYISTHDNTADMFTKALGKSKFEQHRDGLGMTSLRAWTRRSVAG